MVGYRSIHFTFVICGILILLFWESSPIMPYFQKIRLNSPYFVLINCQPKN